MEGCLCWVHEPRGAEEGFPWKLLEEDKFTGYPGQGRGDES